MNRGFSCILLTLAVSTPCWGQTNPALLETIVAAQSKNYELLGQQRYRIVVQGTHEYYRPDKKVTNFRYEEISDGKGRLWGRRDDSVDKYLIESPIHGQGGPLRIEDAPKKLIESAKPGVFNSQTTFALNENEFACLPEKHNPTAEIVRALVPGRLTERAAQHLSGRRPQDYFRFGTMSSSNRTLADTIETSPQPEYFWDAVELQLPDGRTVYHVRRHAAHASVHGAVDLEYVVDPKLHFATTNWIWRHQDGTVGEYGENTIAEAEPGLFLPTASHVRRYKDGAPGPALSTSEILKSGIKDDVAQIYSDTTTKYEVVEVGYVAPPGLFTWKGLGLTNKQAIFVQRADGTMELDNIIDGELVFQQLGNNQS